MPDIVVARLLTKLRTLMSSIMHRRSALMGFSLIGCSCLEVEVVDPLILRTGRLACHPLTWSFHRRRIAAKWTWFKAQFEKATAHIK